MAKPNTSWGYNNTANDGANSGNGSFGAGASSSFWVGLDLANDKIMFLDTQQADGDSRTGAKYPTIIPAAGSLEAQKTFIDDLSATVFDQVPLAGTTNGGQSGGNKRYVFAIYFDGATAGIPYLEAWDTNAHTSAFKTFLGGNGTDTETPANSTLIAITTTNAAPGAATWSGTPLAKTTSRISLDAAALTVAKNMYFNIKQVIGSTFVPVQDSAIVLALRYLYS